MAWDNQPQESLCPQQSLGCQQLALAVCDGKVGMQGWRKLVPGPCGPQEEALEEEMLTVWRTRVQVGLEVASLQVW